MKKIILLTWVILFSIIWGLMESWLFLYRILDDRNYDVPYHLSMIVLAFVILSIFPFILGKSYIFFTIGSTFLWSFVEDISFIIHRVLFHGLDPYNINFPYFFYNTNIYNLPLWYFTHIFIAIICYFLWIRSSPR